MYVARRNAKAVEDHAKATSAKARGAAEAREVRARGELFEAAEKPDTKRQRAKKLSKVDNAAVDDKTARTKAKKKGTGIQYAPAGIPLGSHVVGIDVGALICASICCTTACVHFIPFRCLHAALRLCIRALINEGLVRWFVRFLCCA